jgi:hypothetical protein
MQPPISRYDLCADFDRHVVLFPIRSMTHTAPPGHVQDGRPAAGPQVRVSTHAIHAIRGVVVLDVAGRLGDVVEELDRAIQLALADLPRGLVCDLSGVYEGAEQGAAEVLATAGRHVRDWPGIPVAVACPDPRVRAALAAQPLGRHLIVTPALSSAMSAVQATPAVIVRRLRLAPHPTAPTGAREFVSRTLLDWRLGPVIRFADMVAKELVAHSMLDASADIDMSVAWHQGALRLTVRDNSTNLSRAPYSHLDPHGRKLSVVALLSRAFGFLPTADGGKVAWAVLNAPLPRPPAGPPGPDPASASQESPPLTEIS